MLESSPFRLAAALAATAVLAGCATAQRVDPQLSQAVAEVRARRDAPAAPACPQDALNAISPVNVGFAFNDTELTAAMGQPLIAAAQWIACHPATPVAIQPEADTHGTPLEQDTLARRRAERVRDYLTRHGVAAERVEILPRGQGAPAGQVFLIRAEGRRW